MLFVLLLTGKALSDSVGIKPPTSPNPSTTPGHDKTEPKTRCSALCPVLSTYYAGQNTPKIWEKETASFVQGNNKQFTYLLPVGWFFWEGRGNGTDKLKSKGRDVRSMMHKIDGVKKERKKQTKKKNVGADREEGANWTVRYEENSADKQYTQG